MYNELDSVTQRAGTTPDGPAHTYVPGGFWVRFVANFVDGFILGFIQFPVTFGIGLYMAYREVQGDPLHPLLQMVITYPISFTVIFFYYGWFYANKGATPGKMLLKLRVIHDETGGNLTYGRAFAREVLGKFFSFLTLGIGFIIAGFRADKRALHDFICTTRVLRRVD